MSESGSVSTALAVTREARRRGRPVDAPAGELADVAIESAYEAKPSRPSRRTKQKLLGQKTKVSITLSTGFAGKLAAAAHHVDMFPGELIELELTKRVDELIERAMKRWGFVRSESLPSPSPGADAA